MARPRFWHFFFFRFCFWKSFGQLVSGGYCLLFGFLAMGQAKSVLFCGMILSQCLHPTTLCCHRALCVGRYVSALASWLGHRCGSYGCALCLVLGALCLPPWHFPLGVGTIWLQLLGKWQKLEKLQLVPRCCGSEFKLQAHLGRIMITLDFRKGSNTKQYSAEHNRGAEYEQSEQVGLTSEQLFMREPLTGK